MSIKKQNILYVGGLDSEKATEEVLHAAFIPFGEIKSVNIPKDFSENKNRGFAFVEFDLEEDAADALDNMDGAELFGKVLRCNIARAIPKVAIGKAVWSAEEWIQNSLNEGNQNDMVEGDLQLLNMEPRDEYDPNDE
eukprot:gene14320-19209_t